VKTKTEQVCSCSCGTVKFNIVGLPLFRILCHCTICQRFNKAAYGDVVVYDAASVELPPNGAVSFDTYKPPPNIQRGKCVRCNEPAIERVEIPLMPKLIIIPKSVHGPEAKLPSPMAHIFYDKRVADMMDELPKYQGFVSSQCAFGKYLLKAKLSKNKPT